MEESALFHCAAEVPFPLEGMGGISGFVFPLLTPFLNSIVLSPPFLLMPHLLSFQSVFVVTEIWFPPSLHSFIPTFCWLGKNKQREESMHNIEAGILPMLLYQQRPKQGSSWNKGMWWVCYCFPRVWCACFWVNWEAQSEWAAVALLWVTWPEGKKVVSLEHSSLQLSELLSNCLSHCWEQ